MEEQIKFSVDNFVKYKDNTDPEFAIAKIDILSTRPNSHGLIITKEVLRENITTILGKFVVGEMNFLQNDTSYHTDSQQIFGYFPKEQEIEFVEKESYLIARANAIISKLYAEKMYKMFVKDNERKVSIEMMTNYNKDTKVVKSFNATGVTVLGKKFKGSCPDSKMEIIQFSQDKADEFYKKVSQENNIKKFAEIRRKEMATKHVNHPINTSKEAIYDGDWDGNKSKQDAIKEKNFLTLAPKIFLRLEDGWKDREVTKLDYPVMTLFEGEWVYSRKGLASAKGYAEKENETEVLDKLEKIYEKLNLGEKEEEKMEQEKLAQEEKEKEIGKKEQEKKMEDDCDKCEEHTDEDKEKDEEDSDEKHQTKFSFDPYLDQDALYAFLVNETENYKNLVEDLIKGENLNIIMETCLNAIKERDLAVGKLEEIEMAKVKAEKDLKISQCFDNLKFSITKEKKTEFIEKANKFSLDNFNIWENEVKVFAMENGTLIEKPNDTHVTFGGDLSINQNRATQDDVLARYLKN